MAREEGFVEYEDEDGDEHDKVDLAELLYTAVDCLLETVKLFGT